MSRFLTISKYRSPGSLNDIKVTTIAATPPRATFRNRFVLIFMLLVWEIFLGKNKKNLLRITFRLSFALTNHMRCHTKMSFFSKFQMKLFLLPHTRKQCPPGTDERERVSSKSGLEVRYASRMRRRIRLRSTARLK